MSAPSPEYAPRAREAPCGEHLDIVVDPDAEPGDVLGALARLLISLPQDGTSDTGSDSVPRACETQERRQAGRQADVSRSSIGFDDT